MSAEIAYCQFTPTRCRPGAVSSGVVGHRRKHPSVEGWQSCPQPPKRRQRRHWPPSHFNNFSVGFRPCGGPPEPALRARNRQYPNSSSSRPTWTSAAGTSLLRSTRKAMPLDDSLAFAHDNPLVGFDVIESFDGALRPTDADVCLGRLAQPEVHPKVALGYAIPAAAHLIDLFTLSRGHGDARAQIER